MSLIENLNKSRKELLDLGLRNSLINHRKRAKQVKVHDEISSEILRILVTENKTMSFLAQKEGDNRFDDEDGYVNDDQSQFKLLLGEDYTAKDLAKQHTDNKLQTALNQQQLQKKLLSIHRDAKTFIEEQGVNILYLALGFLHWYESDSSSEPRRAPLILIPVELKRSDVKSSFQIEYSGAEITDNLSLHEKIKSEFGIKFPTMGDAEDIDVNAFFKKASKSISKNDRWQIDPNEMTLGFFSFGKFLMYKDLDDKEWPKGKKPQDNEIINALLTEGFESKPSQYKEDANIDEIIEPGDLHLVMDADSSQIMSILDIIDGKNLVIQGPPGTGKSQTITNIIAEAVGQGKKVLFVSEKMAALEVVKRRLDQVHLGDCALELHSYKTNKKVLLEELESTLNLGKPEEAVKQGDIRLLTRYRDNLNAYAKAVNKKVGKTETTFVIAIGKAQQIKMDVPTPKRFAFSNMSAWDLTKFKDSRILVEKLDRQIEIVGNPSSHPYSGSSISDFLPDDKYEIIELADKALHDQNDLIEKCSPVANDFGNIEITKTKDIRMLIHTARAIEQAPLGLGNFDLLSKHWKHDVLPYFEAKKSLYELNLKYESDWEVDQLLKADLNDLNEKLTKLKEKWWKVVSLDYHKAKKEISKYFKHKKLSKDNDEIIAIISDFSQGRLFIKEVKKLEEIVLPLLNENTNLQTVNWSTLYQAALWFVNQMKNIEEGSLLKNLPEYLAKSSGETMDMELVSNLENSLKTYSNSLKIISKKLDLQAGNQDKGIVLSEMDFSDQTEKLNIWKSNVDSISDWVSYNHVISEMNKEGLGFIVDETIDWSHDRGFLLSSFDYSWFYGISEKAYKENPEIREFNKTDHEMVKQKFMDLDKELFVYNQYRLASAHFEKIPHLSNGGGQLRIIQKELHKKRRHMPIRELMKQTGQVIQEIKPVFMMSPMSIATYIPPGTLEFDLVVFDEASQVKPVDAFGALLRGKQGVVVGDDKQLPPTSFFDSVVIDDEEEDYDSIGDIESILSLFLAKGANEKMLRWHYRSKHDSLIAVSNNEFYNNKLFIFPSCGMNKSAKGLSTQYLPETSYDRGKTRTNPEEAKAVAKAVMKHAEETPELTLGVVAFSVAQRDAIIFQLENLRQQNRIHEHFFHENSEDGEANREPFFVKNLENVQGDERDVIFISVGYGKTKEGYFPMSFGPLNRDGGERRLNVLISRSRLSMKVFSNFKSNDLDLERTNSRGVSALKNFLAYAETGIIDQPYQTGKEPDSPFEEAVLKQLKLHNIDAEPQVGTAGFFIDIGIKNPNNKSEYILGVECDGASYHSSRSARDRDRLRQEVLESLGWKIHRIWSTDWFKNPEIEIKKLLTVIEKAKSLANSAEQNNISSSNNKSQPRKIVREMKGKQDSEEVLTNQVHYIKTSLPIYLGNAELHEVSSHRIAEWVYKIVESESPIHKSVLISRITELAGYKKAGSRIRTAIEQGIRHARMKGYVFEKRDFLWIQEDLKITPRDRSNLINGDKKMEFIAPEEIQAALITQVSNSYSISPDEAGTLAANMLGFSRVTEKMLLEIEKQVDNLLRNKALIKEDGLLSICSN